MPLIKDSLYEFGFGRTDQVVENNVSLLDEAVFSFLYGGLFKVLKSLNLSSILDLEIVFRLFVNFEKGLSFYDIHYFTQAPERTLWRRLKYLEEEDVVMRSRGKSDKRTIKFQLSKNAYAKLIESIPKEDLAITISKIAVSYADKLWMFNVRDPNKIKKTLLNLSRSAVSMSENNFLSQFCFGLAYYYGSNYDLTINHAYKSIQLNKKFAHSRRLFGSALFQIGEKKRAYLEMEKALKLYNDDYGKLRTNYELWQFNYLDGNLKKASELVKKLKEAEPNYPQAYLADLITAGSLKKKASKSKKKLHELVPNFSPGMIKNFHSWITDEQADRFVEDLKFHDL